MKKQLLFVLVLQTCIVSFVQAQKFFIHPEDSSYVPAPVHGLGSYNPTPSRNFQRVLIPLKPIQDSSQVTISALPEDVSIATEYMDYFGRPIQKVIKQASPLKNDYVLPVFYDLFGRTSKQFLPYVQTTANNADGKYKQTALAKDSAFYHSLFPSDNYIYSEQKFEPSPLQTIIKQTSEGQNWTGSGRGKTISYRANAFSDSVRLWDIAITSEDDIPTTSLIYPAGSLLITEVVDEKGVRSLVYKDELGKIILTKSQLDSLPSTGHTGWLCTYYVYDEMNHLRVVMPPKAVALLNTTASWNLSFNSSIVTGLCYSYWFDDNERPIVGVVPGKGKTYIAYDAFGRVVMVQDAGLRASSQWTFVQYDGQGRKIKTGLITSSLNKDSIIIQASRETSYPSLSGTYTITAEIYYDDYSWISSSGTSLTSTLTTTNISGSNFFTSYNVSPEYAQSVEVSNRIRGSITGIKKIIVGTASYLYSLSIYDDHGRVVQAKQINYSAGTDIVTNQYNFSGQLLRSHFAHQKGGSNSQTHSVLTKLNYDHAGRVKTIVKNLDNTGDKTVAQNSFNELGQLQKKILGNAVDSTEYSYNIRGWLMGINKAYVTTSGSTSSYFGEVIYFDSSFTTAQYNGSISGVRWKAGGDGVARGYGFEYDNQNRLLKADFSQINDGATSWTKDKVDFSIDGLAYDAGGNILSMRQKGLIVSSIATIDSLTYEYFTNSDQLKKVNDGITDNSPLGDFKDTTYSGDDYAYDVSGNITKDYNRKMYTGSGSNGAVYNYLNKPDSVVIAGKNTVYYYYDVSGRKLSKKVNDYTSGILVTRTYEYINGFVYLNDTLQYVMQEEGRIRYARKTNSQTGVVYYSFEYDYFLRDHLGNVRTVLTEGRDTTSYVATMETPNSTVEDALFSNIHSPVNTSYPKPTSFDNESGNEYVSRLNASTSVNKKAGPALVLKVMKGDKVQVNTFAWYDTPVQSPESGTNLLNDLLNALSAGVVTGSGGKETSSSGVSSAISPSVTDFLTNGRSYDNTRPKAYLNWILFDEQFQYVSSNSGVVQVSSSTNKQALIAPLQEIAKNGYLYVYVSNESPQDVYFDDITVKHFTGALLQEQSFYPFGLQMAGISSKALNKLSSQYKFNGGVELEEETNYYSTFYRQYDPQIGRFSGVDMLSEDYHQFNAYQFGFDNPITFNDPLGDDANPTTPPTFANVADLLLYIQQHGVSDFPNNFTLYMLGDDGRSLKDPLISGGQPTLNGKEQWGITFYGTAEGSNTYGAEGEMKEFVVVSKWVSLESFRVSWNLYNDNIYKYTNPVNEFLSPGSVPLGGIEYQFGRALDKYNRLDQIKPYNEKWMVKNYGLAERPINIEIPITGRTVELPRNIVKVGGQALKVFGTVSALVSVANDYREYEAGKISGAHFAINTIANGIGFIPGAGGLVSLGWGIIDSFLGDW